MTDTLQAIVFDFDGVLVESVDVKGDAFVALYKNENPAIQKEVLAYHKSHGGVTRFDKIRHYEELCGRAVTDERVNELADKFGVLVEEQVVASAAVSGAQEFVRKYYRTVPFYIASATPEEELQRIARKRGMDKYFEEICGAPVTKDEHLLRIIRENIYDPKRVVMVGDAMTDYSAAKKAGTQFVGRVPPGKDNPFPSGTSVIQDLTALDQFIKLPA